MLSQAYLVLYNGACALGWLYVLYLTLTSLRSGQSAAELWSVVGSPLTIVQSAAALEVLHSLVGLVNSPLLTAAMQVSSRLLLVWGYTRAYPASQAHWSLYLMVASWALVEVPRYAFYVFAQFKGQPVPYPLFWLRYSLFAVLYPSGISGELLQMYTALGAAACPPVWARTTYAVFAIYALGSPYMIYNMYDNRVRSFKKRAADAAPPRPVAGVAWPVTNDKTQERNSTPTNKKLWAEAIGAVSAEARAKLEGERNWRFAYAKHAQANVQLSLQSEAAALAIARAGLAAAQAEFRFRRDLKGVQLDLTLAEAMAGTHAALLGSFATGLIQGTAAGGADSDYALRVPYGGSDPTLPYYLHRDSTVELVGPALLAQLEKWRAWGTIEASAAESIAMVARKPALMNLSNRYFVLLGATSAMGPLDLLLQYGANVIAVDIDRPAVWQTIFRKARASRGRVYFPYRPAGGGGQAPPPPSKRASAAAEVVEFPDPAGDAELAQRSGANLLEATPEIATWLKGVCPGQALTIGNYTYLDGALHVQLSVGCDAIMSALCAARKDTSLAFLCTPTDLHVIPAAASAAAAAAYAAPPAWLSAASALSSALGLGWLAPNALPPVHGLHYVDGLSIAQGPNYALAKRLQHWRAVVARAGGHRVSSNVAPSTATKSVTSNFLFEAAYGGFHAFKPLEVMYQATSNAVMTALLVADLVDDRSAANPKVQLSNPYQLFEHNSFHGGVWRCAYKLDTVGTVSVLYYAAGQYGGVAVAGLAVLAAAVSWVLTGNLPGL